MKTLLTVPVLAWGTHELTLNDYTLFMILFLIEIFRRINVKNDTRYKLYTYVNTYSTLQLIIPTDVVLNVVCMLTGC